MLYYKRLHSDGTQIHRMYAKENTQTSKRRDFGKSFITIDDLKGYSILNFICEVV